MNFIKRVLSSLVAIWLAIAIFIIIGIGVVVTISTDNIKKIGSISILNIDLSGEMNDFVPEGIDPVSDVLGLEDAPIGFNNVIKAIKTAMYDDNIKGINLRNLPATMGWSQASTLRALLAQFKNTGKFVYSFSDVYSQKEYYVNSVADSVFVSPLGVVELKGLHSEVMFYKSFQEKYGVKMEVIRHGKYKSAVEPFIADEMSPSNREQIGELINGLWSEIHTSISNSRDVDVEQSVMNYYGASSVVALKNKLVDGVLYEDEFLGKIKDRLNTDKVEQVSLKNYIKQKSSISLTSNDQKIAVIYAEGQIIYGKGTMNSIGQKMIIKSLHKAVKNKSIKAIVLRVNSPGGSALASDLIWRAVVKAKEKKPVVVSMGNVAASGGYYIACGADRIFAEPTTITGSIGVFGMLPNASKLADKIGIHAEVVSTHNNAAHYSVINPIDSQFKQVVKNGVESIYDQFLDRVSRGRGLTKDQVDEVAQGRVWTGLKALEIGLIDELGSLDTAISYAADQVNIQKYSLKEYPEYELDFKELFSLGTFMKTESEISKLMEKVGLNKMLTFKQILELEGVQARIPFELEIN